MHFKSGTAFPRPSQAQGLRLMPWLLWKLYTMQHRNYPNDIAFDFIKKAVWRYDHLPVGKFWKFWYDSSGFRKVLKPSHNCFVIFSGPWQRSASNRLPEGYPIVFPLRTSYCIFACTTK